MAINAYGNNLSTNGAITPTSNSIKDRTALGKDDFMTLLLVQLQHQDPTEPMDSEKILTQTSQLAGLEATQNTNKALEDLAKSLSNTQQFSTISAIGKTADLGSDRISLDEGSQSAFEIYFPSDVEQGTISITDLSGNAIATIDVGTNKSGVYRFDWNGLDSAGNPAESGIYRVNANYAGSDGVPMQTRLGAYPIESVRFEDGKTLVKVGSNYVPLEQIVEIY